MQRSKQRKLVDALPKFLPPAVLNKALGQIHNPKARAQVEAAYRRRDAGK